MFKTRKFWIVSLVSVLAVAATAAGCRGMHKGFDEEDLRDFVAWKVNRTLNDIDATPAQRQATLAAVNNVLGTVVRMHAQGKATHAVVRAELNKQTPDRKLLHSLIDKRLDEMRSVAHQAADKALDVFATLDKEQREELLTQLDEHCAER